MPDKRRPPEKPKGGSVHEHETAAERSRKAAEEVPSQAEKAKPEPPLPEAQRPAAGPEMELRESPPAEKPTAEPGVTAAEAEEAKEEGEGSPFPVVGIGASAGGLEASTELLRGLPTDTGMAFIFVHHLAPEHESLLVEILQRATAMPVEFAKDGARIEANHVYVGPPNAYIAVFHGTLNLMKQDPAPAGRNAIDYFLRSLSEDQRSRSIGVVLSGTGSDGALGVRAIKAEDGITIAQAPESAAYDGMPRSAIDTGAVDLVLSPSEISQELVRIAHHPYVAPTTPEEQKGVQTRDEREILDKVFLLLRSTTGVDFTYYKPTTVRRRIGRRMLIHHIEDLRDYHKYLQDNPDEVKTLYQDLLINVTGFFREPDSFKALEDEVFPHLMESRGQYDAIRIWVPACSTGEEAYSIAMILTEFLDTQKVKPPIQIFATDVSDTSIEKARVGIYPENISAEVSAQRLHRFFTRTETGYQINKSIRDLCVFAKHDVTRDPPFSRLDLISCRNLLIYLGNVLQRRLIPVLHYALNPTGYLFLGSSESIGEYQNLFTLVDQKFKIYAKKPVAARPPIEFGFRQYPVGQVSERETHPTAPEVGRALSVQREADRIAMDRFVPPGVLVDDDMQILQFRGDTSPFLRHAPGEASLNMLEMARDGLSAALKGWAPKAREQHGTTRMDGIRVSQDGTSRTTDIEIVPLAKTDDRRHYLVFFREPAEARPSRAKGRPVAAEETEVEQLQRDLAQTRDQLRMTIEEKDASTEGLRAANEEIQSSNEELQSINEELETAKEELQSTNEELTTLNEELQNRNYELLSTNDDLRNVLASVNIPILILGKDLRIRRYTPMAERVLNLIPTDVGRPITDLKMKIDVPDLEKIVVDVIKNLTTVERDVKDAQGKWYRLQVRPYRTGEDRIDGVVIAMLDISESKNQKQRFEEETCEAENAEALARAILEHARDPLAVLDDKLRVQQANPAFVTLYDASETKLAGKLVTEAGRGALDGKRFRDLAAEALEKGTASAELDVELPAVGKEQASVSLRRLDRKDAPPLLLLRLQRERGGLKAR